MAENHKTRINDGKSYALGQELSDAHAHAQAISVGEQ